MKNKKQKIKAKEENKLINNTNTKTDEEKRMYIKKEVRNTLNFESM